MKLDYKREKSAVDLSIVMFKYISNFEKLRQIYSPSQIIKPNKFLKGQTWPRKGQHTSPTSRAEPGLQ